MGKISEVRIVNDLLYHLRNEVLDSSVKLEADTNLSSVGIDSYSVIELVLFLERNYGIQIQEKDMLPDNFKSVSALARCAASYQD